MDNHLPPKDLDYKTALYEEHQHLESVDIPIITVSASFRKDLKDRYLESFPDGHDVIFSRAHYSMALGLMLEALSEEKSAWMTDPTNFVARDDWGKILFTEYVGKLMARHQILKDIKDKIDTKARNKLPITKPITEPLLYLTQNIHRPILSLHYETGRILAEAGKKVVQVVTDPHVRPQYLDLLPFVSDTKRYPDLLKRPQAQFCVFDQETKEEFLELAKELHKYVLKDQVVVTGPPIDPRIVECRKYKSYSNIEKRPIRLTITTGGLGTNKPEVASLLHQITRDWLVGASPKLQLLLYAGNHKDFNDMYTEFAHKLDIELQEVPNDDAPVRIIFSDDIVEANEMLVHYAFPWSDGIVCKPSGDMAYDAVAAGCFQLFLEPWGEWEVNIQKRFLRLGTGQDLNVDSFIKEMEKFNHNYWDGSTWFEQAIKKAQNLPPLFLEGSKNIIEVATRKT